MSDQVREEPVSPVQASRQLGPGVKRGVDRPLEALLEGGEGAREGPQVDGSRDEEVDVAFGGPCRVWFAGEEPGVGAEDEGESDALQVPQAVPEGVGNPHGLRHDRAHFAEERVIAVGLEEDEIGLGGPAKQPLALQAEEFPSDRRNGPS